MFNNHPGYTSMPAERLINSGIKPPYKIQSRQGDRWYEVDAVMYDAFGDVMFMHKNAVVRRVNPVSRVNVRK